MEGSHAERLTELQQQVSQAQQQSTAAQDSAKTSADEAQRLTLALTEQQLAHQNELQALHSVQVGGMLTFIFARRASLVLLSVVSWVAC